ncbi:MAG: glycoside hydrolase family 127 protein [Bacteroidales bacterium]|uniref:beta-L-arabinofuranosidase domain-containing protein n=1 Tax=Candidatus Cryptobacteroides sp. TaxID=2952915 RepID=UPI002A75EB50|nr:beta-L-arabinofuranosidase domain-containing protein [Candidatus Cryptobacteroides sp.]MDD7235280.1 glycoside hydrolase family 127 protein [Bacteroidales bacterium]MDY2702390.1 glycoside hydrolase family 127 protein [Candidatus Cryptobacteroides sp.]MDY5043739.1 glycoside hydrolase family 127 protein [Candidatus Cryptobacteroides sp.]
MKKSIAFLAALSLCASVFAQGQRKVENVMEPLPSGAVTLTDYFENDIRKSVENWAKGVMPYDSVVEFFRTGRKQFALGEMVGKAIRTNALMYRYTRDEELRDLTKDVVYSLIGTMKPNGSISCTAVENQPGGTDGDIWERKYVLLALSQYYLDVDQDPKVLDAMEKEAASVMTQIGPQTGVSIKDFGWSDNHIESSTILEPIMRLYYITGKQEYLDYAAYIVDCGGGLGKNMFQAVRDGDPLTSVGQPYPKAYEMTSLWEGLVEYYRATGDPVLLETIEKYFRSVKENEITIIGNGGADVYWPKVCGEAWSNTAVEQTNPSVVRMMETCVGVTWIKYCSQYLRLTGDPSAVDAIEKYIYNGLLGAMRPDGKGFSYVNLLNGEKVTNYGWGWNFDGLPVTCCNLNGPTGLAYIPYVAVMQDAEGPVVNLYNAGKAVAKTAKGDEVVLTVDSQFPRGNEVKISVDPSVAGKFSVRLYMPTWSPDTYVEVNGKAVRGVKPGEYLAISRRWKKGDMIRIVFDFRARLIDAPKGGRNPEGEFFQAVQWGPIVLARDENIDPDYNKPVQVVADENGEVKVRQVTPERPGTRMQFVVPTTGGDIKMVDYSSVDCWKGSHIQTWLPMIR